MFTDIVVAIVLCVLLVAIFWLNVFLYYMMTRQCSLADLLFAEPPENLDWNDQVQKELANFEKDKEQPGPDGVSVKFEQFGVAENYTNEGIDKENEEQGDLWLCDGRPFYFMAIHFILALVLSLMAVGTINSLLIDTAENLGFWAHIGIGALSVLSVALVLGLISYINVVENERVGVKRFGEQLNGYLRTGLQYILPLFETYEPISLRRMIWGPYQPEQSGDAQYIGGIAGTVNPSPGIFKILLARRWGVLVEVAVTMHVARCKNAWYTFLNTYSSTDELGQQIAVIISAILTRAVGEGTGAVPTTAVPTDQNEKDKEDKEELSPENVMTRFNQLANEVPEICSNLLKGLLKIRRRLPVVIESIALTGPIADAELMQWLQVQDESAIGVLQQKRVGEASRQRFDQLLQYLRSVDKDMTGPQLLEAFQHLNAQEVQRLFAEAGKESGSIEALIRAFLVGKVDEVTKPKKPQQGEGTKQSP